MASLDGGQNARRAGGITRTVNAGFAHHQAGRLARAEALYRRALAKAPNHAEALHLLGVIGYQRGAIEAAIRLIAWALPELNERADAHLNYGNALQQAGRLAEAAESYRRAIALDPDYGMAHSNLARVLNDQGAFAAGLESSRRAVTLIPDFLGAQVNCATALNGLERFAEAEAPLRRALELAPDNPQLHSDLGRLMASLGRLGEATASYRRAVVLQPQYPRAHNNLGIALQAQNRFDDAAASYERALSLRPDFAEAHNNLGTALQAQKRLDDAVASYERALALRPDFAEAHNNLGAALKLLGRPEEAEASCRRSLALLPDFAEAHINLGNALRAQHRLDEAVTSYQRALALKPDSPVAHNNLAAALQAQNRLVAAVASYRRALDLAPDHADAYYNLGNVYSLQGKPEEAIASYARALALEPDDTASLAAWFREKQNICDWSGYCENEAGVRRALVSQPTVGTPFALLALSSTPGEQLDCARRIAAKIAVPESVRFASRQPRPGKRVRLGYLSEDFHQHPVARLIVDLIEHHDRRCFEVIGYSYGPDDRSAMRVRLANAFDRFVDITAIPHRQAAGLIHSDAIDILIDLTGYTGEGRSAIPAHRPAAIQVNYLGYPGTMGAEFIDYILVDRFLVPPDQQRFYAERLLHLPNCYQPSDAKREITEPAPSRAECGLPEKGFVFCCFHNSYKITPAFFDIWMGLLRAVPRSVLWLVEANPLVKDNLRREATGRGVAAERLVFGPRLAMPDYLARLGLADLFLDTLPYNAGATANDALWAGLPVLTCAGETYAGRMAGAILTAIGLPELITTSPQAYAALALQLATEPSLLKSLRDKLARNRSTMPLFDIVRFTADIEATYTRIWENRKEGRPPAAFAIPGG